MNWMVVVLVPLVPLVLLVGAAAADEPGLKDAAGKRFLVGAAIMSNALDDPATSAHLRRHFNTLTGENEFKPSSLQPEPGKFTFERADRIIAFAKVNDMTVIGHTLCWHQQAPKWMFEAADGSPLPREQALQNLEQHVQGVLGHFRGRVAGWDVINEALHDRPDVYLRDTPARRAIGDDLVEQVFALAQAADPDVELYYNDYNIERPEKRAKALRLVRELKAKGIRIDGIGIQGHWALTEPPVEMIEEAIQAFAAEGLKVMITELDVDVLPRQEVGADLASVEAVGANPYAAGLPQDVQTALAARYAELFALFRRHEDKISRVTFWGIHDGKTWLNDFPVRGRTNYPLLWNRELQPKPAYQAVVDTLGKE